jgi:hypothetical protein
MMKKSDWKLLVNVLLYVDLLSLAAIGLILALVVAPGGGAAREERYFLGLHRHAWGDFHFYLALTFLALFSLHIWTNWTWVAQTTKSYFGENWKKALLVLSGSWLAVLLFGWVAMH